MVCLMNLSISFYIFLGFCLIANLPQIMLCVYSNNKGMSVAFILLLLFWTTHEYVLIKLINSKSQEIIFYFSKYLFLSPSILITLQAIFCYYYVSVFNKRFFLFIITVSIGNFIINLFFQMDLILFISRNLELFSKLQTFTMENRYLISTISNFLSIFIFIFLYISLSLHYINSRNNETFFLLVAFGSQVFFITNTFYMDFIKTHPSLLEFFNALLIISVSVYISLQIKNKGTLHAYILRQKKMSLFKDEISHFVMTDFKEPLDNLSNISSRDSTEKIVAKVKSTSFRMLNIAVNMLDVYKYNKSEIKLNKSICILTKVIQSSLIRFNSIYKEKNIDVEINCSIDTTINVDENLIERVLVSFLDVLTENKDDNEKVDIFVSELNNEKILIQISSVKNFSMEKVSYITTVLQNLNLDYFDSHSGLLNLSFCKIVIEAHGGEIGFESKEKSNHNFFFTLPSNDKNKLSTTNIDQLNQLCFDLKINITAKERKNMSRYYQLLSDTQLFEVTKLRLMIADFEKNKAINLSWLSEFKVSVREMDDNKYRYLINLIKPSK